MTGNPFDDEHGLRADRALDLSSGSRLWWWRSDLQQEAAMQQRCGSLPDYGLCGSNFRIVSKILLSVSSNLSSEEVDDWSGMNLSGCSVL